MGFFIAICQLPRIFIDMKTLVGNTFYTYSLSDPDTGIPFYIGKGHGDRMHCHEKLVKEGKSFRNKHLYNKISKIISDGKNVIYTKLIENVDEHSAFSNERAQIKSIGRADLNLGPLCNMTDGGDGVSGIICTEQVKQLRRANALGEKNPMYNKNHSSKTKVLISRKKKERDAISTHRHDKAYREKLKTLNPGGIKTAKVVYQIDGEGNIVFEWPSARAAAKALGASHGNISYCASTKPEWKVKGFYWRLKQT